jgi:hypothetical protein
MATARFYHIHSYGSAIHDCHMYYNGNKLIFTDRKNTPAILKFLELTEIGNNILEKEMAEKEQSRDE